MAITISRFIIIVFGTFLILCGIIMLFKPERAREILRKAGSTNFINYAEITLRLIPAIALLFYSEFSRYPSAINILGWFMMITSFILYFVPRKKHHSFSVKAADLIEPLYFQLISPFSFLFGIALIYSVF